MHQPRLWTILLDILILTFSIECICICVASQSMPLLRQLNGRLTHIREHVYKNYGIIFFNYSMHCIELNNLTSSIWKHLNCVVERKSFLSFALDSPFPPFFWRRSFFCGSGQSSESFGLTYERSVASELQCAHQ